jgi:hypothetical protein
MKMMIRMLRLVSAPVLLTVSSLALALPLSRTDITIYDGDSSAATGWEGMQEDDETEPGTVHNQSWDLESFFTYGSNQLGMIAGYDFYNNLGGDYRPGDIFIDINGGIIPGNSTGPNGNVNVNNTFGYEYALDIDWVNLSYSIIQLSPGVIVTTTAAYGINAGSNPWVYVSGGTNIGSGSFTKEINLSNAQTGMSGGSGTGANNHYAAHGFDLSFLGAGTTFTSHFTAACGNDNLMGSSTVVPVPAAVWLFGSAIGVMGLVRRRLRV